MGQPEPASHFMPHPQPGRIQMQYDNHSHQDGIGSQFASPHISQPDEDMIDLTEDDNQD
jgi:hypothetical protein